MLQCTLLMIFFMNLSTGKINSQPSKGLLEGGKYCCSTKRKTNKNMFFANIFFLMARLHSFWQESGVLVLRWQNGEILTLLGKGTVF